MRYVSLVTLFSATVLAVTAPHQAVADSGALTEAPAVHQQWTSKRPDGHAPMGVMFDHMHRAGEWMVGYRYEFMEMDHDGHSAAPHGVMHSARHGAHDIEGEAGQGAPAPHGHDHTMQMHMLDVMYAPSDFVTLMLMVPFMVNEMDHHDPSGQFSTESSGLGDISFTPLIRVFNERRQRVHLITGLSIPTGDTTDRDVYHNGPSRHPYHLRLGSGTFDLLPGVTYLGQSDDWSWGVQGVATIRLGENDEEYTLGDRYLLTAWGARRLNDFASVSLRLAGQVWEDIQGADPTLDVSNPMNAPHEQSGRRLDVALGINLYAPSGALKGHRIGLEVGLPIAHSEDAGVHETQWYFTAGWQYAFH